MSGSILYIPLPFADNRALGVRKLESSIGGVEKSKRFPSRGSGLVRTVPKAARIHPPAERRPDPDEDEQTPRDISRGRSVAGGSLIGSMPGFLAEAGKRHERFAHSGRRQIRHRGGREQIASSLALVRRHPICQPSCRSPKGTGGAGARQRLAASRSSSGSSSALAIETTSQDEGPGGALDVHNIRPHGPEIPGPRHASVHVHAYLGRPVPRGPMVCVAALYVQGGESVFERITARDRAAGL